MAEGRAEQGLGLEVEFEVGWIEKALRSVRHKYGYESKWGSLPRARGIKPKK